jgi:protein-S-isoprenylcysteine O-methyltransferase Ste14
VVILAYNQLYSRSWNTFILRKLANSAEVDLFNQQSHSNNNGHVAERVSFALVLGALLATSGIWFRTSAYRALGRHFTFRVSLQKDHSLVTDWPYNVVRHPSYTGAYATFLGLAVVLAEPRSWARTYFWGHLMKMHGGTLVGSLACTAATLVAIYFALLVAMFFSRTSAEDEMLRRQFGMKWERWAKEVPYRLVPGVY